MKVRTGKSKRPAKTKAAKPGDSSPGSSPAAAARRKITRDASGGDVDLVAELWDDCLADMAKVKDIYHTDYARRSGAAPLLEADPATRAKLLAEGVRRYQQTFAEWDAATSYKSPRKVIGTLVLVGALLRADIPIDEPTLTMLLEEARERSPIFRTPYAGIIRAAERYAAKRPLSEAHRNALGRLRQRLARNKTGDARGHAQRVATLLCGPRAAAAATAKVVPPPQLATAITVAPQPQRAGRAGPGNRKPAAVMRIDDLLRESDAADGVDAPVAGGRPPDPPPRGAGGGRGVDPEVGEPWADQARADLRKMPPPQRAAWQRLLNHAVSARSTQPAQKCLDVAAKHIDAIGCDAFIERIAAWFPLVGKPGVERKIVGWGSQTDATQVSGANADILKGLAWTAASIDDPRAAGPLGDLAERCFQKVRYLGARQPRVANACLVALARMSGPEAVAQISRVQARAKKPSAKKLVERAMSNAAAHHGMSPEELEETAVPACGLDLEGRRGTTLGAWAAEIRVTGARDVELSWSKRSGDGAKSQASIPADVKRDHADALKELKRAHKEIERVLAAQAARIERLLLDGRTWPLDAWRQRYLDHPLVCGIARRLIWQTEGKARATFVHHDGKFIDARDGTVKLLSDATIRIWHPIASPADEVLAWRRWLESHAVAQPFKQAHREIYLLTDAERRTRTYSNRFAGHLLRQHQFHALCGTRGWQYDLMGTWDSANTPTRRLPRHNLRVEFFVDGFAGVDALSQTGVLLHVATDQVRFSRGETGNAIALEQIPPAVFSELMRDVDLFVGVASVGNDPTWHDRGDAYGDAWHRYAFGELTESAETRRDLLSRLIPRLKIAPRCRLEGKFLVVRGELRTYKIHLGSGNILMEPNDQYLCIVPGGRSANEQGGVFLPFEGDGTLSVILSKAFLLADDAKIEDLTITRQIRVK